MEQRPRYIKESTRDLIKLKQVVRPDLKKRNDKLFKVLVSNLNRNVISEN